MKNQISILIMLFAMFTVISANAQKVRWPYQVDGSGYGKGNPATYKAGYAAYAAAPLKEDTEKEAKKAKGKKPAVIHYAYMPLTCKQIAIIENYNPGAITKVIIGYKPDMKKIVKKEVYSAEAKAETEAYYVRNINFESTPNVTDVWIYMEYYKVPGINQISGVALVDSEKPYSPRINTLEYDVFEGEPFYMNDDVSGRAKPTTPIISVDNRYIYFNHNNNGTAIYRGTIGSNGQLSYVEESKFNLPVDKSTVSGIRAVSQDNNVAYVTAYGDKDLEIYKVYMDKNLFGKMKWKYDKISVKGYENVSNYQNEQFSYDGEYIIVRMTKKKKFYNQFGADLYVAKKIKDGKYGELIRMGDDINTMGDEVPCYLAPDNKTFYFASDGKLGYGESDIYMTRRLDDTWTNWSEPINLGPMINSSQTENYFIIDAQAEYAYFVRWEDDGSNIYRLKIAEPEVSDDVEVVVETIKPEPIVVIKGKVLDKKDNSPVFAQIFYYNINTKKLLGEALSNAETGEYSVALPYGINYAYEAKAVDYLPVSENLNTEGLTESQVIEKDLYLVPIEVGQVVRLNNIFFDLGKATLKEESIFELEKLLNVLNSNKSMKIEISGHTDNVGSASYNEKLSGERAKSVMDWLIEKGIDASRLTSKGYGETDPVATNDTEEGRALNRRVEFKITGN